MRFELSEPVYTHGSKNEVLDNVLRHFRKTAEAVKTSDTEIAVTDIEATLGAQIRKDKTSVSLTRINNGYSVSADVRYNPSFLFWLLLPLGVLLPVVGWLIPIGLLIWHYNIVKKSVGATLRRISYDINTASSGEGYQAPGEGYQAPGPTNVTDELVKLAELRKHGDLTDEEFTLRKRQILQSR